MNTIINVANRLPVTIGETIRRSSGGLVAALEGVSESGFALKWVGWPGGSFESIEEQNRVESQLTTEFGYVPVFLTEDEITDYYDGFSNGSLWPILHYSPHLMEYDDNQWDVYEEVNRRFSDQIVKLAGQGDIVWIHDYHLMLVPRMLRESRPDLRIGFFFHTPFPSSEVFRSHPRRTELLQGVTGADQIGFHTYHYSRHFRSAVLRVLGLETDLGSIRHGNHLTSLGVYPIGINAQKFLDEIKQESFHQRCEGLRKHWAGKRIVLSVERLDYSKGILQRLQAIEQFLQFSSNAKDVVFLFINVPSREDVPAYKTLLQSIESEVGRINGKYATIENAPIHFIHQSVDFEELCALYAISEVATVTPLVDGMNLVAKEYLACQLEEEPGVLVLSEFAGAAQELVNAIIVNPFNTKQMSEGLDKALTMPFEERLDRLQKMRGRIIEFDANYWATSFITHLIELDRFIQFPVAIEEAVGAITKRFREADQPALFLDYDGTLREFELIPSDASPNEKVIEVLDALMEARVDVYVISGRDPKILQDWLIGYPFTIIAEHGSLVLESGETEWITLDQASDFSWKAQILEVMRDYVGSTPGSFVEEKNSAIVWHYRQCDPEFGDWKARQLLTVLIALTSNLPVEIHHGKKIVEISSIHVNKGTALKHFVDKHSYDLVLCAGDDQTDEAMFKQKSAEHVSVKVGDGDTHADYRVPDPAQLRSILLELIQ